MDIYRELGLLLRPAGGGLYLVSTGRAEQLALQQRLYGADSEAAVQARFEDTLRKIPEARAVILGVPSDVGAGFRRGANLGPQAIRTALLAEVSDWPARAASSGVVDIGDVFVCPQLLHDDMLSSAQIAASRRSIYPGVDEPLPVSPLSIEERALDLVFQLNPNVVPLVLGGDHSTAWPVAAALSRARKGWGIVQPDAHTDLLEERLGIKYCFATWSFHANELLGRGGKLVQIGTRASRRDREHWERTTGVRQFWADDARARGAVVIDEIIDHLERVGVTSVYGTDDSWADATGTPEPGGLDPELVVQLIRRLGAEIGLCAGDVMEVAPGLGPSRESTDRTVGLAVRYLRETIAAVLHDPTFRP